MSRQTEHDDHVKHEQQPGGPPGCDKGEHIMRSMNSPPVTAVSQTVSFIDEYHYLIEFDPQHINSRGRVKMTYQAILQMAELKG